MTSPAPLDDWLRAATRALADQAARLADRCEQADPPPPEAIASQLGELMTQVQALRSQINIRTRTPRAPDMGVSQARTNFATLAESTVEHGTITYLSRRGRRIAAVVPAAIADAFAPPEAITVAEMQYVRENFAATVRQAGEGRCIVVTHKLSEGGFIAIVPPDLLGKTEA
ncbi:hypothetical protein [Actinomadura sp. NEAU-AAG7]|uniref:hypothetical protein n=1 Tax=Actinomadura sp. NEAU-AAG7 TaxID=2839640 RepID=UPI001BE41E79|nr:hypothetical protein [Actinomadura sp. NEAU-AAG7]MBT2213498.1 hypothetical protein [Actinomadura sp. NEAU-AAG7]